MHGTAYPGRLIGDYEVIDYIGAGGMGEVYRAVHTRIGQVVAIKVISRDRADAETLERFSREAIIQAKLSHPNIAAFHGFTESNGSPCIVMEYVDGGTLSDLIRFRGPLSPRHAISFAIKIAEALKYIHSQGIIHRDIKSSNIKVDSEGRIKLLDFGIATSTAIPGMTMTGNVVGSLQSLAPELLAGRRADARSDIWALGVLLYEMVTGRTPFEAPNVTQICRAIESGNFPPPVDLNPAVTPEVTAIIRKCLRKKPGDRYRSAGDLLIDLEKARMSTEGRIGKKPSVRLPELFSRIRILNLPAAAIALVLMIALYIVANRGPSGPHGEVSIRTTEGPAEVWEDDDYLGRTPISFKAPLGKRLNLKLLCEGYKTREFTIQVAEGVNEYDYTLEKDDLRER